jgi:hypothetical protein
LAFIIEVTRGARPWRLALYFGAILATVSGTGVILVAVALGFAAVRHTDRRIRRLFVPLLLAIAITLATPVGGLFRARAANESSSQGSSFNARFTDPYKRVYNDLSVNNSHLAVGRGAGYADRDAQAVFVATGEPIEYSVLPKLVFEYGLLAGLIFAVFLATSLLKDARSVTIAFAIFFMQFFLSGSLLQAHTVAVAYILTAMFAGAAGLAAPRERRRVAMIATA